MQASFRVKVKVYWSATGKFEVLDSSLEEDEQDEEEMDEDKDESLTTSQNGDEEGLNTGYWDFLMILFLTCKIINCFLLI